MNVFLELQPKENSKKEVKGSQLSSTGCPVNIASITFGCLDLFEEYRSMIVLTQNSHFFVMSRLKRGFYLTKGAENCYGPIFDIFIQRRFLIKLMGLCGSYALIIAHGLCLSGLSCLANITYE